MWLVDDRLGLRLLNLQVCFIYKISFPINCLSENIVIDKIMLKLIKKTEVHCSNYKGLPGLGSELGTFHFCFLSLYHWTTMLPLILKASYDVLTLDDLTFIVNDKVCLVGNVTDIETTLSLLHRPQPNSRAQGKYIHFHPRHLRCHCHMHFNERFSG